MSYISTLELNFPLESLDESREILAKFVEVPHTSSILQSSMGSAPAALKIPRACADEALEQYIQSSGNASSDQIGEQILIPGTLKLEVSSEDVRWTFIHDSGGPPTQRYILLNSKALHQVICNTLEGTDRCQAYIEGEDSSDKTVIFNAREKV